MIRQEIVLGNAKVIFINYNDKTDAQFHIRLQLEKGEIVHIYFENLTDIHIRNNQGQYEENISFDELKKLES